MDKKAIFEIFFKCNSDDEHKFNDFLQMTHAGKRIIFLVIHLALIILSLQSTFHLQKSVATFPYCPIQMYMEN